MDFESTFIGNEENFKDAFANNVNISNFISKIKNFIYYSDVETAMKLENKNLVGVLWLGCLLEHRDSNAKAVYLDINMKTSPKQTLSSEDNTMIILPMTKTVESRKKQHDGKQKKANKRTPPNALTTDANGDDTKGQLQSQSPHQSVHEVNEVNTPVPIKDLNASHSQEDEEPKLPYLYGGDRVNPYIQDLKSLSEDTFMINSSTNGTHDRPADPPDKEVPEDHPITVSTALDNLRIISDETPLSKSKKDQHSDLLITPKHSFLPNYQRVSNEIQDNQYETTISPNGNWNTIKKIKNPKAVLDALKSSTTQRSNNISMHVKNEEDAPITYDTYVKLSDIEEYFAHLSRDTIEQAVTKLLGSRRFFIKKLGLKPSKNNPDTITVFITVKDLDKCKKLKDIWSIEIDRILYRFAPAHAKDNDIVSRKKYSGEFVSFDNQTYWQRYKKRIWHRTLATYFDSSPRNYNINWSSRNKKLAKLQTIRPPPLDKLVSITHQENNHHIEIRQEEHHTFSHNPHKHKLKNKQHLTLTLSNLKQHNTPASHFTGANTVPLGKRIKGAINTNSPSKDTSNSCDISSSSNSSIN
ncbi:hypothetical protein GLOIN_2v1780196 [Rhizophagus clarus]|uniref:Uncharacterized protein n=1 Tax=Rhizophagus clarus TaxID=94130 RepID=A0A8H3L723_9GLOM|nr:hypothetical protein GLOIN_2v1780196 [Rhizophagus clarus]